MIIANWPLTHQVGVLSTTRIGGVSTSPYQSFNLAFHVGDNAEHVAENRRLLHGYVPNPIVWLEQVHGADVVNVDKQFEIAQIHKADALFTRLPQQPLAIMTADCLPILLASRDGQEVAAIHGGWRPLSLSIIEKTLACFSASRDDIYAWLGPAIGPTAFEVGEDVVAAFSHLDQPGLFKPCHDGKYFANIFAIATTQLHDAGVNQIYGEQLCTVNEPERFFSYRRDTVTGRMATLIWRK
ncbi:peptidoglycan editing factor PgeF [Pseudoalteromonas sp. T1lg65]|uniref:peptidoglycan editing factor PgeF n=1 Tax=Pseudoalteromonas sp. T1lg65 TaxID=2077101 RepID=UPI003F793F4B